ncbi:MAG: hypothetical protein ACOCQM_05885 [Natronomonas sp.]
MEDSESVSTMRLYGATIALVSGLYSGSLSVAGMEMTFGARFMLGLGAVVFVHGVVLLTPAADSPGDASGPLMLVYAALMLLNQLRLQFSSGTGIMNDGMGGGMGGGMGSAAMMGTDPGMVAIAALMLASGVIMTVRDDGM